MSTYLFDTSAFSLFLLGKIPEKWKRFWNDVCLIRKNKLILFEPLISEIFYQFSKQIGFDKTKEKIEWIKSLPTSEMVLLDDNIAIIAGKYKINFSIFSISLVDCYILALAQRKNATILTTDAGLKNSARKLNINTNFIPFKEIES